MSELIEIRAIEDAVGRFVWLNGERVEQHCIAMLASGWPDDEVDGWVEQYINDIEGNVVVNRSGEYPSLVTIRRHGRVRWQYDNDKR